MSEPVSREYEAHPCTLVDLLVEKLSLEVRGDADRSALVPPENFSLRRGHGASQDDGTVVVGVGAVLGDLEQDGFHCEVFLRGLFEVDYARFARGDVPHWAAHNAPVVLYPYLRENVSALTLRAGMHRVFLPLLTVPSFHAHVKEQEVAPDGETASSD